MPEVRSKQQLAAYPKPVPDMPEVSTRQLLAAYPNVSTTHRHIPGTNCTEIRAREMPAAVGLEVKAGSRPYA
eukprot:2244868-Rhodomonas_salina.1